MTLSEIRLRVRFALGLRKSDGFSVLPNPLIDHLANEAQRQCRLLLRDRTKNRFGDFEGTRAERLPSDFLVDVEVWAERDADTGFQGYRLTPVPYRELVEVTSRFDSENLNTGTPRRYSIISSGKSPDSYTTGVIKAGQFHAGDLDDDGNVITVGMTVTTSTETTNAALIFYDPIPTADTRRDIFYVPLPAEMNSDDDEPDFDEIYHELVLSKTRELAAMEIGDMNRWVAFSQASLPLLSQHRIIASQRRASNVAQTRVSY